MAVALRAVVALAAAEVAVVAALLTAVDVVLAFALPWRCAS